MIRNDELKAAIFEKLVKNHRQEVIWWLNRRYKNLSVEDCEDVFQEGSLELWKKFRDEMDDWKGEPITGLLKTICRNIATHYLRGKVESSSWDDKFAPEANSIEMDFGYITPSSYRDLLREKMYSLIDQLHDDDRKFIQMYLNKMSSERLRETFGFKNTNVVKVRKRRIVERLCKASADGQASACPSFFFRGIFPAHFSRVHL